MSVCALVRMLARTCVLVWKEKRELTEGSMKKRAIYSFSNIFPSAFPHIQKMCRVLWLKTKY